MSEEKAKHYRVDWKKLFYDMTTYEDGSRVPIDKQLEALRICNENIYRKYIATHFFEDITNKDFQALEIEEQKPKKFVKTPPEQRPKSMVNGSIKAITPKAILLQTKNGVEGWIPKQSIHSQFKEEKGLLQTFLAEDWVLKKNKMIAQV